MTPEEINHIKKEVDDAASKLAEHVDSVIIFVTKQGDGSSSNTFSCFTGRGNFYAQIGQVREWVIRQNEYVKLEARNQDDEEEGL